LGYAKKSTYFYEIEDFGKAKSQKMLHMSKKSSNFARYFHYYRILDNGYWIMEKGKEN